jgi:hypothetical protein
MKSNKEFIKEYLGFEIWESRYSWDSWIAAEPIVDIRTNKIYNKGDLIFALVSYLDENNKVVYVNELQYFKKYSKED